MCYFFTLRDSQWEISMALCFTEALCSLGVMENKWLLIPKNKQQKWTLTTVCLLYENRREEEKGECLWIKHGESRWKAWSLIHFKESKSMSQGLLGFDVKGEREEEGFWDEWVQHRGSWVWRRCCFRLSRRESLPQFLSLSNILIIKLVDSVYYQGGIERRLRGRTVKLKCVISNMSVTVCVLL